MDLLTLFNNYLQKREKSAEKSGGLEARFVLLTNQTYTHDVVTIERSLMVTVQTTQFLVGSISHRIDLPLILLHDKHTSGHPGFILEAFVIFRNKEYLHEQAE